MISRRASALFLVRRQIEIEFVLTGIDFFSQFGFGVVPRWNRRWVGYYVWRNRYSHGIRPDDATHNTPLVGKLIAAVRGGSARRGRLRTIGLENNVGFFQRFAIQRDASSHRRQLRASFAAASKTHHQQHETNWQNVNFEIRHRYTPFPSVRRVSRG